ncbi:uncharacterized protein KRP23_9379 [Phytophthora ramorum]|uniref:Uncharacterized protein n=1 Tax=Phytophthora ramorum TaxID=164328 RepID=H3GIU9_PHYRM|nr:hypothetical protein KRP23_9379 [Phytophthora ramorum]
MKVINTTAFALVCLLAQAASAKKNFDSLDHASGHGNANATTSVSFDPAGAKMQVCPTGDCSNGKFMRLTVLSLTELTSTGAEVAKNKANNFTATSDWTDIVTVMVGGVNVSSTTFVSKLTVGSTSVAFNLTASIPQANWTVTYGSQAFIVPAGALKFTVDVGKWPFDTTTNTLALALKLDAKGPNGKAVGRPEKKAKTQGTKGNSTIDRVDMGESMFMDAPSIVFIDGKEANVTNSSVIQVGSDSAFQWVFPHFLDTLHYDPVVGDSSTTTTTTTSSSSSSGAATTTPAASSASKLSLSSLAATGLVALAYSFF